MVHRSTNGQELISALSQRITGEWRDIIHYKSGPKKGTIEVIEGENVITDGMKIVIAALLKNDTRYKGITYWAIGDGNVIWDVPRQPQIFRLDFTDPVTTQGYAALNLNTQPITVLLTLGWTPAQVCDAFLAAQYSTWAVEKLSSTALQFTSTYAGNRTQGSSYDPISTGAQGVLSLMQEGSDSTFRPQPLPTDKQLGHEFTRKYVSPEDINYIDSTGNAVPDPTNILEVYSVFDETEAIGVWREFGIYGGTATSTPNSGQMINHKIHGIIDKSTDLMVIERRLRFTFR